MKHFLTTLFIASYFLISTSSISAQDGDKQVKGNNQQEQAKQIRIYTETIEITSIAFAELMTDPTTNNDDTELRNAMIKKCKNGTAKLISNHTLTVRNHDRAVVESVKEFIYPTEYDAPELSDKKALKKEGEPNITPPNPTAFETRNIGSSIEIEPSTEDNKTINLKFKPEFTQFLGFSNYGEWNIGPIKANIIMPNFYTKRADLSLILSNGKFIMAYSHEPAKDGKADNSRKIITFIRAEILNSAK